MAIRKILCFPDTRLRHKAKRVETFDADLHALLDDMMETMYDAQGIGLAATQIGIDQHIAVIDVTPDKSKQWVMINGDIIKRDGKEKMEEGCLSVPGFRDSVDRATHVTLRAQDRDGKPYEIEADGLLAHAIQHEMDHLDGKLYIDYLSNLKRNRIRKKCEKDIRLSRGDL